MNLASILNAVKQVGAATPAFQALFNQVLPLFGQADQDTLKAAMQKARAASDKAHEGLQSAARGD